MPGRAGASAGLVFAHATRTMNTLRAQPTKPVASTRGPTEASPGRRGRMSLGQAAELLKRLHASRPISLGILTEPAAYEAFQLVCSTGIGGVVDVPVNRVASGMEKRAHDWAGTSKVFGQGFPFAGGPPKSETHTINSGYELRPWQDDYSTPQGGYERVPIDSRKVTRTFWMPALAQLLREEGTVQIGSRTVDGWLDQQGAVHRELPRDSEARSARAEVRKLFAVEDAPGGATKLDLSPLANVLRKQVRLEPLSGKEEKALLALRRLIDAHDSFAVHPSPDRLVPFPQSQLRHPSAKEALIEAVICQAHAEAVRGTISKQLASLADKDLDALLSMPTLSVQFAEARKAFIAPEGWSSRFGKALGTPSPEGHRYTTEVYLTHIFLRDPTRMLTALESFLGGLDPMGETAPRVDAKKIVKALEKMNLESMAATS